MKECRVCKAETLVDGLRHLQAAAFLLRTIQDKADLSDMCQDHIRREGISRRQTLHREASLDGRR